MKNKILFQRPRLLKASLVLLLAAAPIQWSFAQFTFSTSRTTLGQVIKTVQSQSKYQFFYDDQSSNMPIENLNVKNVSLEQLLNTALKGKNLTYKIEITLFICLRLPNNRIRFRHRPNVRSAVRL